MLVLQVRTVSKQLKVSGKPKELRDALGGICMIDVAFIEQAYIEVSSAAVFRETGWKKGLFKRLSATSAGSIEIARYPFKTQPMNNPPIRN